MARLTLEESGETRRFKLSSGKLTFGSGETATLRLNSADVAELHGQIEMGPEGAVLRTAKGVMPAKAGGKSLSGPHTMKAGQAVTIGSAKLSIEYDEGEGPKVTAPVRGAGGSSRGGGARRSSRSGTREDASGGGRPPSRKQTQKASVPSWVVAVGVLVAVVGVGYGLINMAGESFDFDVRYRRYQREKQEDGPIRAQETLADIAQQELTPSQRQLIDKELATYKKTIEVIDDSLRNQNVNKWFAVRLKKYYDSKWNPAGNRAHARLFVKRAKWFMAEYPTHPEIDWVRRVLDRVEPVADLGSPMELEDLRIDVWGATAAEPKHFKEAFEAIERFAAANPTGIEKAGAEQLKAETLDVERVFYDEKLGDAAVVYDRIKYPTKYKPGDAIEDMVRIIVGCHTHALRADAAIRLMSITEFTPAMLAAYKRTQPERFESLIEMDEIYSFAEKSGLL